MSGIFDLAGPVGARDIAPTGVAYASHIGCQEKTKTEAPKPADSGIHLSRPWRMSSTKRPAPRKRNRECRSREAAGRGIGPKPCPEKWAAEKRTVDSVPAICIDGLGDRSRGSILR